MPQVRCTLDFKLAALPQGFSSYVLIRYRAGLICFRHRISGWVPLSGTVLAQV